MNESFKAYYNQASDPAKLWENCVFVFDANVLLNIYRYSKETSDDLLEVLDRIRHRVWLPHQAALEYFQNRPYVVAEQRKKFSDVKKIVNRSMQQLKSDLQVLQLHKRHAVIDPDKLTLPIDKVVEGFLQDLDKLEADSPDVNKDDEILKKLEQIFKGRVGPAFKSQHDIDELEKEGITRYKNGIPPGYMDYSKGESGEKSKTSTAHIYNNMVIKREFGDFFLWKQILQWSSNNKISNVVFITDDEKEDWWWLCDSGGSRNLGPRVELIQEIQKNSSVDCFHMYGSERFLYWAKEFVYKEVRDESIEQVKELAVNSESKLSPPTSFEHLIVDCINSLYPSSVIETGNSFPKYTVHLDDGRRLGFEVIDPNLPLTIFKIKYIQALQQAKIKMPLLRNKLSGFQFILPYSNSKQASSICEVYDKHRNLSGASISVMGAEITTDKKGNTRFSPAFVLGEEFFGG